MTNYEGAVCIRGTAYFTLSAASQEDAEDQVASGVIEPDMVDISDISGLCTVTEREVRAATSSSEGEGIFSITASVVGDAWFQIEAATEQEAISGIESEEGTLVMTNFNEIDVC